MNAFEKSESIKTSLRQGFQDGSSKMAKRKCYGYTVGSDGKLLSNEKYTGRVLLQKTISTGVSQIKNDGLMARYLYTGTHEAIISDEMFMAVQEEKLDRTKNPERAVAISLTF